MANFCEAKRLSVLAELARRRVYDELGGSPHSNVMDLDFVDSDRRCGVSSDSPNSRAVKREWRVGFPGDVEGHVPELCD